MMAMAQAVLIIAGAGFIVGSLFLPPIAGFVASFLGGSMITWAVLAA
jgi:hypothetical protein